MEEREVAWWDGVKGSQRGCGSNCGHGECLCLVRYAWCVQDDEEYDDDVLNGKEKALAVRGEWIVIAEGIRQRYSVRVFRGCTLAGNSTSRASFEKNERRKMIFWSNVLSRTCGTFTIDPPSIIPIHKPLDRTYLRH